MFERYANEFEETNRVALEPARWDGAKVGDILYAYVQVSVDNDRERPVRRRAGVELARAEPEIHEHMVKLRVMLDTGIGELLLARRDEIGHPDPELAVTFVLDQMGSMIRTRLHEPDMPSRFATHADEEFLRESLYSVCAYLQTELPAEL